MGGVKWGLGKTRALLADADDPHLAYPTIHIGGTNGKGSTAAVVASVLARSGLRVGLYTSPHLRHFSERVRIDGRPADPDVLLAQSRALAAAMERAQPTFFEAATVLAFHAFRSLEVDVAVIEVGLGGRLDSTNVVEPEVTAITSIALDHREYLGDTLPAIAAEKAGILKPEVPCVTPVAHPAVVDVIRDRAAQVGAPLHLVRAPDPSDIELSWQGTRFQAETPYGDVALTLPLIGLHQATNACLAIRIVSLLPERLRPDRATVLEGLDRVFWPGRLQVERAKGVRWIFDIAHNPAAVHTLASSLDHLPGPQPDVALVGVLGDKDWPAMLPPLIHRARRVLLTVPPSAAPGRVWNPHTALASLECSDNVLVEEDFGRALSVATARAEGGTVLVTGSSHTVGDALEALDLPV